MSILVVLMCLAGVSVCDESTAALVIRKEMTNAACAANVEVIVPLVQAGVYQHPPGGGYTLYCKPLEPKA